MRLDRPIGAWLLVMPGYWAIMAATGGISQMTPVTVKALVLFTIGAFVMRGAGCVINDLWDRDLDAKVARTSLRPLPAGEVSIRQAFAFLAFLCLIGLAIVLQFNLITIIIGIASIILITLYPLMKRVTWWPQFFLGLTFNIPALMGWSAITGSVESRSLMLYSACIFWTLGYDTIYAHQDKDDDAKIGIKSTALLFKQDSKKWIAGFYVACIALLSLVDPAEFYLLIPAALHMVWQLKTWDINSPENSLKIFKSNFVTGLLVLGAFCL